MEAIDLIANLAFVLTAVDVAVYAISVSLLGSQLKRNMIHITRRLRETQYDIRDIQAGVSPSRASLSDIEAEVEDFKEEEKDLQDKLFCLTVKGAVLYPCIFFAIVLILVVVNSLVPAFAFWITVGALVFLVLGCYRISYTLRSIDFAATSIPLPVFGVSFFDENTSLQMTHTNRQTVEIGVGNTGFDIGELISFCIFFPPGFVVHESEDYDTNIQPSSSIYPSHTGVFVDWDRLQVDEWKGLSVDITAPSQAGTYRIPSVVSERKTAQQSFDLEIVVR